MTEVVPLPAASVIVVRDDPFEVLMLRRHEKSSFVPGAWVFPGGIAEPSDRDLAREIADDSELTTMRVAAARETFEESGVWLGSSLPRSDEQRADMLAGRSTFRELATRASIDLQRLVWTSRWITPIGIPKRFDTWFFVTAVSRDTVATAENLELVDVTWVSPAAALARAAAGEMPMVFPTLRNLEAIADFPSSAALIESRRNAVIEPVLPVLVNGRPTLR